jgi:hypothetical protein
MYSLLKSGTRWRLAQISIRAARLLLIHGFFGCLRTFFLASPPNVRRIEGNSQAGSGFPGEKDFPGDSLLDGNTSKPAVYHA